VYTKENLENIPNMFIIGPKVQIFHNYSCLKPLNYLKADYVFGVDMKSKMPVTLGHNLSSLQLTYTTLLNSGTRSRFYSPKEFLKMAVI
jgi:hypothetical protein